MLDLHGFNYKPNDFEGLYKMGDDYKQERLRKEQLLRQQQANQNANAKYLTDYLDSKDHLTGTPFDPVLVQKYQGVLGKALQYAKEGADLPNILMAIGKDVSDLNEYSTKAKTLDQKLKGQLGQLKEFKGYNIQALDQEAKKSAFYNPDGTLKDISQVDPDQDYIGGVIKNSPEKVTNDAGLDDFIFKAGKLENDQDITTYKPTGGMSKKRVKVVAAPFMQLDTDNKGIVTTNDLVPQYEHALDNGQVLQHNGQPVRLLDDKLFKSIMSQRPDLADWVRGQVKQHLNEYKNSTGEDVDMNSSQAANVARAILYDELKGRARGSVTDNQIQNKPSAQEIKINLGYPAYGKIGGSGGGSGDADINNVFGRIKEKIDKSYADGNQWQQINTLDNDEQGVVFDTLKKSGHNDLTESDIQLQKTNDGRYFIAYSKKGAADNGVKVGQPIAFLSFTGTNLPKQANSKAKVETVRQGNKQQQTTSNPHTQDGYSRAELKKAGWTDAQIETATKAGKIKVHD